MSGQQQTLDGEQATPAPHLKATAGGDDQEWRCEGCEFRVTRSPTRPIEYGHATDCEHWIGRGSFSNDVESDGGAR